MLEALDPRWVVLAGIVTACVSGLVLGAVYGHWVAEYDSRRAHAEDIERIRRAEAARDQAQAQLVDWLRSYERAASRLGPPSPQFLALVTAVTDGLRDDLCEADEPGCCRPICLGCDRLNRARAGYGLPPVKGKP